MQYPNKKSTYSQIGVLYAIPQQTQRNEYIIITSKRRFDVIITCLLRFVFAGTVQYWPINKI